MKNKKTIKVSISHIKHEIPIFILFRALGIDSDKDIIEYILLNIQPNIHKTFISIIKDSLEESLEIQNKQAAIEYLTRFINISYMNENITKERKIKHVNNLLNNDLLPHITSNDNKMNIKTLKKKAIFISYMVQKLLLTHFKYRNFDDRDSYINKRIETPGILLGNLFKMYFNKVI